MGETTTDYPALGGFGALVQAVGNLIDGPEGAEWSVYAHYRAPRGRILLGLGLMTCGVAWRDAAPEVRAVFWYARGGVLQVPVPEVYRLSPLRPEATARQLVEAVETGRRVARACEPLQAWGGRDHGGRKVAFAFLPERMPGKAEALAGFGAGMRRVPDLDAWQVVCPSVWAMYRAGLAVPCAGCGAMVEPSEARVLRHSVVCAGCVQ